MGSSKRIADAMERLAKDALTKTGFWENILPRINQGNVIPIISSSFRIEQIFREPAGAPVEKTEMAEDERTVVESLIAQWANLIDYPMQDNYSLARVAQYYMVEQKDNPHARAKIMDFLKTLLLSIVSFDPDYSDLAARLKNQIQELRFSEIVHQLDYPRFPSTSEDPLRVLARFPMPIYITTSQSDFMERALEAEGKKPRTQVCFWSGEISSVIPEHRPDLEFTPSVTNPLVYHLYGLEDYPQTLVFSEDDYINFLISVMEDTNNLNPKIPVNIRGALGESQLLLIGYRLSDWDFRVLFRLILKFRIDGFSPRGILIQLKQKEKELSKTEKALGYLSRYFDGKKFDIEWRDSEAFIQKLWNEWNAYREKQL